MFYQIFLSPKVKRCTIITYKYGVYELPHELPNDLSEGNIRKVSKPHKMIAYVQSSCQNKNFVNTNKKLSKKRN